MIPLAPIERVAKKAGAERIAKDAMEYLQKTLEEIGLDLARDSAAAARHAKRKTLMKEDVCIAAKKPDINKM